MTPTVFSKLIELLTLKLKVLSYWYLGFLLPLMVTCTQSTGVAQRSEHPETFSFHF